MKIEAKDIIVSFDNETGYTTEIINPEDEFKMNFVLENSDWGRVDGFDEYNVQESENGISIKSKNNDLTLTIEKIVSKGKYIEKYTVTNDGYADFFLNRDNFGIHFPYNCTFEKKENLQNNSCITSVWCGCDVAWMCSKKPSGYDEFLTGYVTEGSFSDYSLYYDVSRVNMGANYRGDIVLLPDACVILSGESIIFSFVFCFSKTSPDKEILNAYNKMRISADKYSVFSGEKINGLFECIDGIDDLVISCNGDKIDFEKQGNTAKFMLVFNNVGEKTIVAYTGGKKTFMKINVLNPLEDILIKRAEFITKKQQYLNERSPYNGAYLIYDRGLDCLYCDEIFADSNACRERLSMGVVVLQALQKKYDQFMFDSISKHREFVEREVFDKNTGIVFNGIGRNNKWHRAYNYPWMAVYYIEWYNLTKEKKYLKSAAKIMIAYYEDANGGRQESPCMRLAELYWLLEAEHMCDLQNKLKECIYSHADRILANANSFFSSEVTCTQFMFCGKVNVLSQAYMISGDNKYLEFIPEYIKRAKAFYAHQPDYHINLLAVRYWDLFWFGKSKSYGDSMPQWLSSLPAETYDFMHKIGFGAEYKNMSEEVLKNNLCAFLDDGFASAGYLVPYKVDQYSSNPEYKNVCMQPKVTYGKKFDDFANDQDWALYYAVKLLS